MRYDKYKSSGIDWLAEMPNHWQLLRVKDIGKVVLGKMLNNTAQVGYEFRHYLKSKNINWLNVNIDSVEEMYFSKHEMKQYRIKKNDLLLSEGGEVGKTCIWNDEVNECYIQNSVHKITTFKNKDPRYYLYLSFSLGSSKYYDKIVNQVSIKHLTWEKLIKVIWLVPPIGEQTAIAQYLDTKSQAIDKKINLLSKKAEYYKELRKSIINDAVCKGLVKNIKLKESELGIQIASHFEIKRLKDICKIINGYAFKSNEYLDFGLPVVRIGDINFDIDFAKVAFVSEEHRILAKDSKIKKGDILMAMTGATIGKNSFYNTDREAYLNQRVCSFRVNKNIETKFLGHFISSMFFQDVVQLICGGSAQENISKAQLEIFKIIVPPIEEQIAIATYLDENTQKIDAIVANIGKQIETLKELRKTLINDVVTGKIKVTNN